MNSPCYLWYFSNYTYFAITRCFQFVVQAAIPSILILILNVFMYKKLKETKNSVDLKMSKDETFRKSTIIMTTRESLKKSIFRAKLTLSITGIFVCSQMIMWIPTLPYEVIFTNFFSRIRDFSLVFFLNSRFSILFFFTWDIYWIFFFEFGYFPDFFSNLGFFSNLF